MPRLYDRFWTHPEATAAARPHLPDAAWSELVRLVTAGDAAPIRDWLARTSPPALARAAVKAALPPVDAVPALFDELAVGCVRYHDGAGTVDRVLSRRVGERFCHRVYADGSGSVMSQWETPQPLTRRSSSTSPAPARGWSGTRSSARGARRRSSRSGTGEIAA